MLDVSFSELMLIGIVALVVIGPERLPKVARTAGHLFGRLQRYVNNVKADISREMQLDELKKLKGELQDSARGFQRSMTSEMESLEKTATDAAQTVSQGLTPSVDEAAPPAPGSGKGAPVAPGANQGTSAAESSSTPAHKV